VDKLLVALCVFAFGSVPALAYDLDTQPLSKMTTEEAKAASAAAKAKWDKMTPDEKAAVKKAIANKRVQDLTAVEAVAADQLYKPMVGDFWTKRELDMLRPSTSTQGRQPPLTQVPKQQKATPAEQR
jgi:hypothetical protein